MPPNVNGETDTVAKVVLSPKDKNEENIVD